MPKAKYKWEDVGEREWFETTTEEMQYTYNSDGMYLRSAGVVGTKELPWHAEIKNLGEWKFIGSFHTGREAKYAAIAAYEKRINAMRILLIRDSEKLLGSFDVGWRIVNRCEQTLETWWGNCKGDEAILQKLIADCRVVHTFIVEDARRNRHTLPIPVHSCRDYISEIGENYESTVVTLRCTMCGETWKEEVPQ